MRVTHDFGALRSGRAALLWRRDTARALHPRAMSSSAPGAEPQPVADAALNRALQRLGYDRFRAGQREAVETLLRNGRVLLVAPTGGGKSLAYQLPAVMLPGTTVVVSPLISLMNDQVRALEERGIPATYLASTLPQEEVFQRLDGLRAGRYKLVFVAPERLVFPGFRAVLQALDCPLVAVDEAHCISEWGHDFRPEYMAISRILTLLPRARVLACTATATPIVRDEILARLGLPADTPQLVHGFARPNLVLRAKEVSSKAKREQSVDALLREALSGPSLGRGMAIIYGPTRRKVEEEAQRLQTRGWRAVAYHAGLPSEQRSHAQRRFSSGELDVVVATNAFGMGIDRPDVRAVVHLAPPGSIEAYYQEVGRAGRDGEHALGMMLLSPNDMPLRRRLLEQNLDGIEPDPAVVEHKWNLYLELIRWAEGGSCRHDGILRYFGVGTPEAAGCGRCDVCQGDIAHEPMAQAELQLIVRKALSGVARVHGKYGLSAAAKLLVGSKDERLERFGLSAVATFGVLKQYKEAWVTALLRRCVTAGWIGFTGEDRPLVYLTAEGQAVMRGELAPRVLLPPFHEVAASRGPRSASRAAVLDDSDVDDELFDALRAHRLEVAKSNGVPPYVVASDRSLRDLARLCPTDRNGLQNVHGFGPKKAEKYGDGLLAVIAKNRR